MWPEACGAAIKDLRTQLTRNVNKDPRDAGSNNPEGSTRPQYHHDTSATSPHVIGRTASHTTVPTSADLAQERNVAAGPDATPSTRREALNAGTARTPRESYGFDSTSMLADTSLTIPSDDVVPPPGGFPHNALAFEEPFQFPSNDNQDLFAGFDIPFWLGQDQYAGMINEWQ